MEVRFGMKRVPRTMSGLGVAVFVLGAWLGGAACASGQTTGQAGVADGSLGRRLRDTNSALNRHGVNLSGWVQMDGSSVAKGGLPNADGFIGQYLIDVALAVDTGKLLHVPGGTLNVEAQSHSGSNILDRQMPAIQDPDNMDAAPGTWLAKLYYEQDLMQQKVQLQGGLMYMDDRFASVPYCEQFLSLDFASDASISTFVLPTFPKGSWGGNVRVMPVKGLTLAGGVYNDHSTELSYDPGGNLWVTEEKWESRWRGLPYQVKVGAWRDTGKFERFQGGTVHHASGLYVVAGRTWWRPSGSKDRGVGTFFQYGQAPESVAAVRRHVGAGAVWYGPVKARPADQIGFAFSDGLLTRQSTFAHGFENEFELYYLVDVGHGLTVSPDLEYYQHPNGDGQPNTLLGLVRLMYEF